MFTKLPNKMISCSACVLLSRCTCSQCPLLIQKHEWSLTVANWHLLMILYCTAFAAFHCPVLMYIWTGGAASRHTVAPISHTTCDNLTIRGLLLSNQVDPVLIPELTIRLKYLLKVMHLERIVN